MRVRSADRSNSAIHNRDSLRPASKQQESIPDFKRITETLSGGHEFIRALALAFVWGQGISKKRRNATSLYWDCLQSEDYRTQKSDHFTKVRELSDICTRFVY